MGKFIIFFYEFLIFSFSSLYYKPMKFYLKIAEAYNKKEKIGTISLTKLRGLCQIRIFDINILLKAKEVDFQFSKYRIK